MTISSRTPEGDPNHCPVCGHDVTMEPSLPFGDAPCPHCGQLLIFLRHNGQTRFWKRTEGADLRQSLLNILSEQWNVPKERLAQHPAFQRNWDGDSLDLVEFVMELEEEFGAGSEEC